MGIRIFRIGIVDIISGNQRNIQFPAHFQKFRVHHSLLRVSVILQFQKIISLPETCLIFPGSLPGFLRKSLDNIPLHLACQTGRQGNQPFMIAVQDFHVHPGLVIISFRETFADNLHQVGVTGIVLCQQHQMIIPVLSPGQFLIKTGVWRHIHLAADNGFYPRAFGCPVKINDTVHGTVIRYGSAVHPQFFHPGNIFFDFIGTVQKGIFRVDMQMYECHAKTPFFIKYTP